MIWEAIKAASERMPASLGRVTFVTTKTDAGPVEVGIVEIHRMEIETSFRFEEALKAQPGIDARIGTWTRGGREGWYDYKFVVTLLPLKADDVQITRF